MSSLSILFAIGLFAGGSPPPTPAKIAPESAAPLVYKVRIVEAPNFDLRETMLADSPPISAKGSTAVWIADRDTVSKLRERGATRLAMPMIRVAPGQEGKIATSGRHPYRVALALDPGQNGVVVKHDRVPETSELKIRGGMIDQGALVHVAYREEHVITVHKMILVERFEKSSKSGAQAEPVVANEIPETAKFEIAGDWLIPPGKDLVIGLGMHTVWENQKPKVTERALVISVESSKPGTEPRAESTVWSFPTVQAGRVVAEALPPAVPPSRSLPGSLPDTELAAFDPAPIAVSSLPSPQMEVSLPPLPPPATKPLLPPAPPPLVAVDSKRDEALAKTSLPDRTDKTKKSPANDQPFDLTAPLWKRTCRIISFLCLTRSAWDSRIMPGSMSSMSLKAPAPGEQLSLRRPNPSNSRQRFRAELMAQLRSIEQMYWAPPCPHKAPGRGNQVPARR